METVTFKDDLLFQLNTAECQEEQDDDRFYPEHTCFACADHLPSLSQVRNHLQSHKLTFCSDCSKCVLQVSLKTHKITCSKKKTIIEYLCDKCDFSTRFKSSLNAHHKAHDDGRLDHQCGTCRKTFKTSASLEIHRVKAHKEKFPCHICDKTFTTKRRRDDHVKTHTDPKVPMCPNGNTKFHECPDCDYKTPKMSNMIRHQKRWHAPRKPVVFSAGLLWKMVSRRLISMKHGKAFIKEFRDQLGKVA